MSSACSFIFMQIGHFHKNGFALRLAQKQRHKGTREWPDLFAVSVSATVSAAIYLRTFFCHKISNFNAANSEMLRVNTFVNFLFSFTGEKINKRLKRSIRLKTAHRRHFLNRATDDSKRYAVTKGFFALKREN